ncbi:tyrosine--tRNA ligase [Rhizocola hellebori]|uniref:tyrosine--tRNA ligase n=1 Tax=Rhizocola hellebori TaxID=1392758 RepID=UPI001940EA37|nr:tyrosine--tRNA ligase [Rhizocola hellebori]
MTDILDDLHWRGLLKDSTGLDDLRKALVSGQVTFYVGFDPTAASIHIGNLVQVLTARRLQLAGHKPLLLVGGATGQIGDPKDSGERTLNDPSVVAGWVERIRRQVEPFFDFDGPNAATMVNNLDWTGPMSAIEFLRDVGKHFPVNRMLAKDIVKNRLESGISFTEFSYQLIQGNDFYELNQRHGCVLQFGGSDQWGNITSGVDYIRRRGAGPVHAFCTPLVTKADGTKFGKTEGGTIWLDGEMTTPYAFYQFWFNVDDRDVIPYLKYFSLRSREEIEELERETAERPFARAAQKALAEELTTLLHGKDETQQVITAAQALFGRGDLAELGVSTLRAALAEAGLLQVSELPSLALLLKDSGLASSLGDARRAAAEGGVYVNNERVSNVDDPASPGALLHGKLLVLRRGKKTIAGVELV